MVEGRLGVQSFETGVKGGLACKGLQPTESCTFRKVVKKDVKIKESTGQHGRVGRRHKCLTPQKSGACGVVSEARPLQA